MTERVSLSPEQQALLALRLQQRASAPAAPAIPKRPASSSSPLSFAQERLWFLEQLEAGSPTYNNPAFVRLTGALRADVLQRCLSEILRRHEVLRASFPVVEGQPRQVFAPQQPWPLVRIDLADLPPSEREAAARELADAEARRPFDVSTGPLFRAKLVRLAAQEHLLLVTLHHLISDGWSLGILLEELAALYTAFLLDKPSPLPDLPIQYADFASWQRQQLGCERLEAQRRYWLRQLSGPVPLLSLPTDRPRPAARSSRGGLHYFSLPTDLSRILLAWSRRESVTSFMTLLATFQALLHRYTGQTDLWVGSPVAGRGAVETEGLIGLFLNTLIFRTDLGGDPSFRELTQRVRKVALQAYAHQDLPFEKLVEALQPDRDPSRPPLCQVMLVSNNAPRSCSEMPGLTLRPLEVDTGTAKFDLTLSVWESAEGLGGTLNYSTDLFEAGTIHRMLGHLRTLLEAALARPDERSSTLSLLTEPERHHLLVAANATRADYPAERCFHELFQAEAARVPDAVALVFEDDHVTYHELNRRANQVAHHLRRHGVGPEVVVGLCTHRSPEMLVGLLGILKAGGAYLPLDPVHPAERLAFMLQDTAAPVLLAGTGLAAALPDYPGQVVCLDRDWPRIARESDQNPVRTAGPDNLAYVIYTSGSTGKPKGALLAHRGLCNLAQAEIDPLRVGAGSRVLQFASLSFDGSVWEIAMTLANGATFCLGRRETLFSPAGLVRVLREDVVTLAKMPPSVLAALPVSELPDLRTLIVAGERCPPELVDRWSEGRDFFNAYGPTENTVCASLFRATRPAGQHLPIGRPLPNKKLYILDCNLQIAPIGVPGELHIGGIGLARGYLNCPGLSAERFIPDPFSGEPGARLYRTGDLVRYRSDGEIEFLGRLDHQVKVRGFRIELGEIEAVLGQHPGVRQAVVLLRDDTPDDPRLVAYIVASRQPAPEVTELRRFLRARLPDYMVPSSFVLLDRLPLTSNGKVNRHLLPAHGRTRAHLDDWFYAPLWKPAPSSPRAEVPPSTTAARWLVFADTRGLGDHLARRLKEQGKEVTVVVAGDQLRRLGTRRFTLAPGHGHDYTLLIEELYRQGGLPEGIVHCWSVSESLPATGTIEETLAAAEEAGRLGFFSLLSLVQALGQYAGTRPVPLWVVSNHVQRVTGDEPINPARATVLGLCKVIPQEYPYLLCRSIDIDPALDEPQLAGLAGLLLAEVGADPSETVVAYRAGQRWLRAVEPVEAPQPRVEQLPLREKGVYLITGGLGGIGLVLADYLAREWQARLVLLSRSAFPEASAWGAWLAAHASSDATSRKIRQVQRLQEAGAEVLIVQANVGDVERMRGILTHIREQLGPVNGVIHAAGLPASGMMQRKTAESAARVLEPKVRGTLVLGALVEKERLDFLVLCSSLGSLLGGFGGADYCAANAFLDAFAWGKGGSGEGRIVSINWGTWQEVGMAAEGRLPRDLQPFLAERLQDGLRSEEGVEAFRRILALRAAQVAVTRQDLPALLARRGLHPGVASLEQLHRRYQSHSVYPRPALENDFVAPRNGVEHRTAAIWRGLLALDRVGVQDDFFDLGGHSLLAAQVINRLSAAFGVSLPLQKLFEEPTVAELSEAIIEALGGLEAAEKIATAPAAQDDLWGEQASALIAAGPTGNEET